MSEPSVYERVLGDRFGLLPPELRRYFGTPDAGTHGAGHGVFEVAGSRLLWLRPLLAASATLHILFPEYERDVPFAVVNTPVGDVLRAHRTFAFRGRTRVMVDELRVVDGRLHDFLGVGRVLEVALELRVEDAALTMRSTNAWVHVAGRRVRLPRFLSARVILTERWEHDHQRVSVSLRHPLFGEIFVYRGTFVYEFVAD